MITDYASYIEYFKSLAASHVALKDFVYGGSTRILSRENSDLNYPCLWLEVPDIVPESGSDDLRIRFSNGLMILQNTPRDFDLEDDALNSTYLIALSIIQKLIEDHESGQFDFNVRGSVLQAKPPFSGDNDFGWHFDFDLSISASDCINENDWE